MKVLFLIYSPQNTLDTFAERYSECDYISINATFPDKKPRLEHMSMADVGELLESLHPKLVTIAHMGVILIELGPEKYAGQISTAQTKVIAGKDGMVVDIENLNVYVPAETERKDDDYYLVK